MGRDDVMHGTASASQPGRFEVDLTSVCVRLGAIQLPFRLRNTFDNGAVTALDAVEGGQLELEFRPPRQLVGFQPFFAAHGLRTNDRIALVFDAGGLRVEAIRRERGASGRPAGALERALDAAESGRDGASPDHAGASKAAAKRAVVRERIRGNAPPLMTRPDFGAGFATLLDAKADGTGAADGSAKQGAGAASALPRWEPLDVMAPPDGWPEVVEGDLREAARAQGHVVVREVRRSRPSQAAVPKAPEAPDAGPAEGEAAARAAGAIPLPGNRVTARSTTARHAAVQAAALERVVAQRSVPPQEAPERPEPTHAPQEASARPAPAPHAGAPRAMPPHPVPSRSGTPRAGTPRSSGPRPIAQRAPSRPVAADELRDASEPPASGAVTPQQSLVGHDVAARPEVASQPPVRREAARAARAEAPADGGGALDAGGRPGRGLELFGIRLRLRRGRTDDAGGPQPQARGRTAAAPLAAAVEQPAAAAAKGRDDFTDAFLEFDDAASDAGDTDGLAPGRPRPWLPTGEYRPTEASPRAGSARRGGDGGSGRMPAPPAPTASAIPAQPARAQAESWSPQPESGLRPEDDFAVVNAYLARPDVPAIVRTEHVAMSLGVSTDRVERVMLRIAEDRERVTRIRSGAYMVRRRPAEAGSEA